MRFDFLLAPVIALSLPAFSSAIDCARIPTSDTDSKILKAACQGIEARDRYRQAIQEESAARSLLLEGIEDDWTRRKTLDAWQDANAIREVAKLEMEAKFREATNLTLERYRIAPSLIEGDITRGPVTGGRSLWVPRYAFRMGHKEGVLREVDMPAKPGVPARKAYWKWTQPKIEEERALALTWPDGRVDILDEAFEAVLAKGSPRVLGYLLHHESAHYDQLRGGKWKTFNEREVDAYKVSVRDAARFQLNPDEIAGLNELLNYNRKKVQRQKYGFEKPPHELPTPAEEAANRDEWHRLEQAMREAPRQRERLRQQLELEREGRNAPAPDPGEAAPNESEMNPLSEAEANSRFFCESPQYIRGAPAATTVWGDAVLRVPRDLPVLNLDNRTGTMSCANYVTYQAIYHSRNGVDVRNVDVIAGLVAEGLTRQTDPNPRNSPGRMSPPSPNFPPSTASPVREQPPVLVPADPEPRRTTPKPPDYNHCIHGRCLDLP